MYVLADLEWVGNKQGSISPTQLAATRVDENWNTVDEFYCRMKPHDNSFCQWNHVAYNGGDPDDFLEADAAYCAFSEFENWLAPDDTVCWWLDESRDNMSILIKTILRRDFILESIVLCNFISEFLWGGTVRTGNPYSLCKKYGLQILSPMHDSRNDVEMMRRFLEEIGFPQDELTKPTPTLRLEKNQNSKSSKETFPFVCALDAEYIHLQTCQDAPTEEPLRYFRSLASAVKNNIKPCPCCTAAYRAAARDRNADTIRKSQYNYVFAENSKVFHKRECRLILSANDILGAVKFNSRQLVGRQPCKRCCPTIADQKEIYNQVTNKKTHKTVKHTLNEDEKKAIARFKQAKKERNSRDLESFQSDTERNDFYTLTQPRFAFWAGVGYNTFHVRNCKKLQGIDNIKGFAKYKDAVRAGHKPCKYCKPTSKQDMNLSIPITNEERQTDSVNDLIKSCTEYGFSYSKCPKSFLIETKVGKWRIHTETKPIKLEHINLVKGTKQEYHVQPRLFLSLSDVFQYIARHDENLIFSSKFGNAAKVALA